ncbi:hypothetical protein A9R05_40855 (plasmid) [Burkholderia sp. KK1]|nr:hypothetical protein A9R05_40855 [Burkholderia sp. KK1]
MNRLLVCVMATLLVFAGADPAIGQDLAQQKLALEEIRKTADSICYTVKQEGQSIDNDLNVHIKGKLNTAIAKIIDLDVGAADKLKTNSYKGVVQDQLAATLQHTEDCKKDVFDKLVDLMLKPVQSRKSNKSGHLSSGGIRLALSEGKLDNPEYVMKWRLVISNPTDSTLLVRKGHWTTSSGDYSDFSAIEPQSVNPTSAGYIDAVVYDTRDRRRLTDIVAKVLYADRKRVLKDTTVQCAIFIDVSTATDDGTFSLSTDCRDLLW